MHRGSWIWSRLSELKKSACKTAITWYRTTSVCSNNDFLLHEISPVEPSVELGPCSVDSNDVTELQEDPFTVLFRTLFSILEVANLTSEFVESNDSYQSHVIKMSENKAHDFLVEAIGMYGSYAVSGPSSDAEISLMCALQTCLRQFNNQHSSALDAVILYVQEPDRALDCNTRSVDKEPTGGTRFMEKGPARIASHPDALEDITSYAARMTSSDEHSIPTSIPTEILPEPTSMSPTPSSESPPKLSIDWCSSIKYTIKSELEHRIISRRSPDISCLNCSQQSCDDNGLVHECDDDTTNGGVGISVPTDNSSSTQITDIDASTAAWGASASNFALSTIGGGMMGVGEVLSTVSGLLATQSGVAPTEDECSSSDLSDSCQFIDSVNDSWQNISVSLPTGYGEFPSTSSYTDAESYPWLLVTSVALAHGELSHKLCILSMAFHSALL